MGHFHKPMCKVRPLFIILFALVVHAPQCVAKVDHVDEVQWIYVQLVETRPIDNLNLAGQTWSGQERILTNDDALRSENCVCGDEASVSSEGWCYIGETSNDPSSERLVSITVPIAAQPFRCSPYIVVGKSYLYCNKLNNSDVCLSMLPEPSPSLSSSPSSLASSDGSNERLSCTAGYIVCDGPSCYTWCTQVGFLSTDTSHGEADLTNPDMRIMPKDEGGGSHLSETGTALIIISFLALVIILSIIWGMKQRRKGNAHAHSLAKKIWSHLKFKHDRTAEGSAGRDNSGHRSGTRDAHQVFRENPSKSTDRQLPGNQTQAARVPIISISSMDETEQKIENQPEQGHLGDHQFLDVPLTPPPGQANPNDSYFQRLHHGGYRHSSHPELHHIYNFFNRYHPTPQHNGSNSINHPHYIQREQRSFNHNSHSNHYYYHHSPTGHRMFLPSDRPHEHLHQDTSRSRRGSSNASDHGEGQLAKALSHESLTDAVFVQPNPKPVFTLEPVDGEEEGLY